MSGRSSPPRPRTAEAPGLGPLAPAAPAWGLLGACGAALFWPWLPLVVWPAVAAWLWPRRRDHRAAAVLALLLLGASIWAGARLWVTHERSRPAVAAGTILADYAAALDDLELRAAALARELAADSAGRSERLDLFRRLARERERGDPPPGLTALLVDRDGVAVAWSGDGLRHDLPEAELPASGLHSVSSFAAVTLYAVEPLDENRRPARVVVGRSFATTTLPFDRGSLRADREADGVPRWSVVEAGRPPGFRRSAQHWDLVPERGPVLRVRAEWLTPGVDPPERRAAPRGWWVSLAVGAVFVALGSRRALARPQSPSPGDDPLPPLAVAVLVILHGIGASAPALVLAAAGTGLTIVAARTQSLALRPAGKIVAGTALAALVLGAAWAIQRVLGPTDLGASLRVSVEGWTLRLGSFAAAAAGFWILGRGDRAAGSTRASGLLGVAALAAGATAVERPLLAALLVLVAGGALASALGGLARPARWFATVVAAAALSAAAWGAAERHGLRAALRTGLAATAADARSEIGAAKLAEQVDRDLAATDLGWLSLGAPGRLGDWQDLALALWLASPLARQGVLSALMVLPDDAPASSFSYGLPIDETTGELATDARRWPVAEAAAQWAANALSGSVPLLEDGRSRGEVRYWYLPLRVARAAGDRGAARADTTTLTRDLLRSSEDGLALMRLPNGVRVELGSAAIWRGPSAPAVRVQLVDRQGFTGWALPGRPFWVAGPAPLVPGSGLLVRLRAPALGPLEALRWSAVHATAVLLALLALGAAALLLALGRGALRRQLGRWLSSYSRKLVLVSTVLVVLPLALLNVLLLRAFEQRLEQEQRANGEDALRSAERILSDYLPTLEPGFSIETELDDALLSWLAQVVSHEVNLYWRGYVYASSKRELFTAGILPRRIPGEVFSELDPAAAATVARTNRVAPELSYLELYRSIRLPDEAGGAGSSRLFLSVPLLAQQEEVTSTLAVFQQQALVVTAALLVALLAVASRLAASFTTPLTQIVRGTARIAEGASSLGLRPSEPELAALVEAIDDMARRIADTRERLVREKQVVDSVVANITSAVVSIGRDARVQMSNRKAVELLECRVGDALDDLARRQTVEPLRSLLERRPPLLEQRTARFAGGEGVEREWTIVWVPVPGAGDPAALLVVEDVTEVLRGQRLEAWAQMARIIAHEIKNPLTPIRLSAEHLLRVWQQAPDRLDEVFERCIDNILDQVGELRDTAAEFSTYSQIPSAEPSTGDLIEAVRQVVEGYALAPPDGVAIRLEAPVGPLRLRFDRRLLGRAVRNLIENALHACRGSGGPIEVRVAQEGNVVSIEVADRGPGVPEASLPRIFEPNFSTSVGGTGLGLPITLRIAEQHGGTVVAENRADGGLRVTLRLPIVGTAPP